MRKFSELKKFMNDNLQKEKLYFKLFGTRFQVYQNGTDMNISAGTSFGAVIKFEERQQNIFTVAVANNEECIINYGNSKSFSLEDDITSLINAFPDGYFIDEVVAALLSIKEIN